MLRFLLPVLVVLFAPAHASDDHRICAPFRDGVVDEALVGEMLEAAKDGHLYRIHSTTSRVGFCVESLIGRVEAEFEGFRGGLALRREVWGDESRMMVMIDSDSLKTERSISVYGPISQDPVREQRVEVGKRYGRQSVRHAHDARHQQTGQIQN